MRLRVLVLTVLAVLAVPSVATARTGKSHPRNHGQAAAIVGTWSADVTPDQGPPLTALLTFTRGGSVFETESDAPGTGQGAWKRIGPNRFAFAFQTYFLTATGDPGGHVVVRAVVTLTNDTLSGPFKFQVFDPAGNPVPDQPGQPSSGSGTATAKRFVIPPL
jgi:hypothetical protein